ncbi:tetratricopeptide repeat protein [Limobrevibacterium gyesilva]|uniref:protein O-GlcNAc transferase n=1 Tax=Limobrevibacterium gyesilva TaxID=2991712 RepID=A0AA41YQ36_9PROT|nr:tetratricopeptide repeat protein [Limobrevibacterium gyesilva]MCW3476512.1 tetratricopeptide repeat protein [Limobrevibacterium gyesilva]
MTALLTERDMPASVVRSSRAPGFPETGDDTSPTMLLNKALTEERQGNADAARAWFAEVSRQLPEWDEPVLRRAESFRFAGDDTEAGAAYERVLELNPNRPEALLGLGCLRLKCGDWQQAQTLILRCCAVAPDRADVWDALGVSLLLSGDWPAAESAFAEAHRLDPGNIEIALRRVDAALGAGSGETELCRLELASGNDPTNAALICARGALLERLGRRSEAADLLEVAVALAPGSATATAQLAQCLTREHRIAQAIPYFEAAIALAPDDLGLRNNHAAALVRANRHREAHDALEALIREHGEHVGLLCNLSNALASLGLQEEGAATARRAVEIAPGADTAWRTLCNALPYCDGIGGAALLQAYRSAAATLSRGTPGRVGTPPDPQRRIRLGLLSPALKVHPVGWLTVAAFEALDPEAFDIVCLGPHYADDPIQRQFRAIAAEWHTLDQHVGSARVEQLRGLEIDVLIELSGYGDHGLMGLCAERLAPVQVKWVGSQNHSTGLKEMDWFLTDRWETPPELAAFYAERLLVLPDGYVCYSPPAYAPPVAALPALRAGRVTFGCFNNLAKVTATVIETWSAILRRVPGSRFVLKCHQMADAQTRARILHGFARHGVAADRIELRGASPHRELLRQYGDIDIVLDPFPYNGGLTTCEALWMGVPTVTVPGETFASRHSTSHLSNVGLADWVAADRAEYERLAVRWAGDLAALAQLRQGLRARVKASPLCDGPRFGRNLGAALRHAWRDWCARERD